MNPMFNLPKHFKSVPLKAIRFSTRTAIAIKLNHKIDFVDSDIGLINNYIGLAELIGLSTEQLRFVSSKENPTYELLELWEQSIDLEPTLGKLWEYLLELKRFDALTDSRKAIGMIYEISLVSLITFLYYSKCAVMSQKFPFTELNCILSR